MAPDLSRYQRQTLLPPIGETGQRRLMGATVLLVGCGALGTTIASLLARAGVGRLVIVDRDVVEWTNLQRQVLFTEAHARRAMAKAHAAAEEIARFNSEVTVHPLAQDVTHHNLEAILGGRGYDHPPCSLILDGTDNFQTRFLLNDAAVKLAVPYIYGGVVASHGMTMTILPHTAPAHAAGDTPWEQAGLATPCLRCVFGDAPPAGSDQTCDTAGVLGPAVSVIASIQAAEAIKLLVHDPASVARGLMRLDLWTNHTQRLDTDASYQPGACVCCGQRRFIYLEGKGASAATALCGRNAVQLTGQNQGATLDLPAIADRLRPHGPVTCQPRLLQATVHDRGRDYELTLFPDGRAIVRGTEHPDTAQNLYARYVGG